MNSSDISSYLSINVLTIGISSFTPMMYLCMGTIKCTSKADHIQNVYDQCSGVLIPQISIRMFLLIMMVARLSSLPSPIPPSPPTTSSNPTYPTASSSKAPSLASPISTTLTSSPILKRGKLLVAFGIFHR